MSSSDLARMLDEIAANYSYLDDEQAAVKTASHLRRFWTPAMRASLLDEVDGSRLSPVAARARELVAGG